MSLSYHYCMFQKYLIKFPYQLKFNYYGNNFFTCIENISPYVTFNESLSQILSQQFQPLSVRMWRLLTICFLPSCLHSIYFNLHSGLYFHFCVYKQYIKFYLAFLADFPPHPELAQITQNFSAVCFAFTFQQREFIQNTILSLIQTGNHCFAI